MRAAPEEPRGDSKSEDDIEGLKQKYFSEANASNQDSSPSEPEAQQGEDAAGQWRSTEEYVGRWLSPIELGREARRALDRQGMDTVNPIELGAKARRAFDDVWTQLSQLSAPTKRFNYDDEVMSPQDAEVPQAAYTTVLVVGATGRVGRILTRKLLLRGYKVKALVRRKQGREDGLVEGVPPAVKLIYGDVGENRDCQEAVRGVNKIIYCAGARSNFTGELLRVEEAGVRNIVKAFQDECIRVAERNRGKKTPGAKVPLFTDKTKKEVADFSRQYHQARWDVTFVGVTEPEANQSERSKEMAKYNQAFAEINDEENLIFEGVLYQRGAVAEVGAKMDSVLPGGDHRTANTEGLVLRLRGDGKQYACVLQTASGHCYVARFPTRTGYLHLRLPWTTFRDETPGQPPLDPEQIVYMGLRYEFRRNADRTQRGMPTPEEVEAMKKERQFELEVDWIKALPGGVEPDFVLVSRAGKASADETTSAENAKIVEFKRKGEETLRLSGLGYTIIRPGTLVEEPGGYRALVFDQGDRITQSVSAADIADICLRSLHEPAARNKTFDVCYEYQAEGGLQMYEMVAHVPDKSNSYLQAAVSSLAKNT